VQQCRTLTQKLTHGDGREILRFFYLSGPGHFKTLLDALVDRAVVLVMGQSAVGIRAFSFGNFQMVAQLDRRDAKQFIVALDAAFDVGFQIICCRNSTRFQRAGKCAGQSTGKRGDHMVDGGGQGLDILDAVILGVAAVRAELERLGEALDMSFPERALLLNQADFRGVNDFAHRVASRDRQRCELHINGSVLLVVLNERENI